MGDNMGSTKKIQGTLVNNTVDKVQIFLFLKNMIYNWKIFEIKKIIL